VLPLAKFQTETLPERRIDVRPTHPSAIKREDYAPTLVFFYLFYKHGA
jgi:hypothetical protein